MQHLLDMRAGTRFDEENYDDPDSDGRLIEQVSGYTTRLRADLPADTYEWIRQLVNDEPHGGAFKYRSILPDVLAWVMTAATGETFADLFADHVWSQFAADDADIIVDAAGFPIVEGGICTTLEDLARVRLDVSAGRPATRAADRAGGVDASPDDSIARSTSTRSCCLDRQTGRVPTLATATSGGSTTAWPASTAVSGSTGRC